MKLGIIGVGSVGGAIASRIVASCAPHEIVLIDTNAKRANAAAGDLSHASVFGENIKIISGNYRALSDADIIIISAGANQKIGQTRDELVQVNANVMLDVVPKIMNFADRKNVILIVVTNPLDSMTTAVQKLSRLPNERVIGTGTMLDSARLRYELAHHFDISPHSIDAFVLGEHGDTSVINWDSVSIDGILLKEFVTRTKIPFTEKMKLDMIGRVHNAAYAIIDGRGATWDGIAAVTTDLVKCISNDERRVMPVSIVDGNHVAYSLPRTVGKKGVISTFPQPNISECIKTIKKTYRIIA